MIRRSFLTVPLASLLLLGGLFCYGQSTEWRPARTIPTLSKSRQLILVVTPSWDSISGELTCYHRSDLNQRWERAQPSTPVVVGRSGLAWGLGLHSDTPSATRAKKEGDGCAPAGAFLLIEAFGYAPAAQAGITKFPYHPLTDATAGVDDPVSRYYNRIVEPGAGVPKDWQSAEQMRRTDDLYRWGVVVGHNWKPVPGAGSCIFLHLWEGPNRGTAGCTAMSGEMIEKIVRWLDRDSFPILVQLPRSEYEELKQGWRLP